MSEAPDFFPSLAEPRIGSSGQREDRAVLKVNGELFEDWETVAVKHQMGGQPPISFRFTCSEGMPLAKNFAKLRIKPGMDCEIVLAGWLAFSGKVVVRQVYYDAHRHHIEIQGGTYSYTATRVSAVTKTGEFKNVTYEQAVRGLMKPTNVPVKFYGEFPKFKFPRISIIPGQTIYEMLEMLSRQVGAQLGSNNKGDLVVVGQNVPSGGSDTLVEGVNIVDARELWFNRAYEGKYTGTQSPGTNQSWGAEPTSHRFVEKTQQSFGTGAPAVPHGGGARTGGADPISTVQMFGGMDDWSQPSGAKGYHGVSAEVPVPSNAHLQSRQNADVAADSNDQKTVVASVWGWLRPSGGLWQAYPTPQKVYVTSPMLIMENEELNLTAVTFTQDDRNGTRSALELKNKAAMGFFPQVNG